VAGRRLLITGGAGFIGGRLVARLAACGDGPLTVLDDESTGDRAALAGLPVRFVAGDVCDPGWLDRVVPGQDAVIHLAARGGVVDSLSDPDPSFRANAAGSLCLLEACRRHGVEHVLAASTGGALLGEVPGAADETVPARPLSPYGASKLAMEGYLSAYGAAYGLRTLALRFSNVYGPGSLHKQGAVSRFFLAKLAGRPFTVAGDGSQVRDYLYVDDLMDAVLAALDRGTTGVLQLGTGTPTTLNALIEQMTAASGGSAPELRYAPARHGEVHTTWCDIARARAELEFEPKTPLADGLARTWAWFRANAAHGPASPSGLMP
jgi:UDP-glucose 4-epimerase